jgi:hypothetical protein
LFPYFLDNRLTDDGEFASTRAGRPPFTPGRFVALISVRGWINPQGHSAAGRNPQPSYNYLQLTLCLKNVWSLNFRTVSVIITLYWLVIRDLSLGVQTVEKRGTLSCGGYTCAATAELDRSPSNKVSKTQPRGLLEGPPRAIKCCVCVGGGGGIKGNWDTGRYQQVASLTAWGLQDSRRAWWMRRKDVILTWRDCVQSRYRQQHNVRMLWHVTTWRWSRQQYTSTRDMELPSCDCTH